MIGTAIVKTLEGNGCGGIVVMRGTMRCCCNDRLEGSVM